jgi:DNA primase
MLDKELESALRKIDVETFLEQEGIDFRHSYGTRGLQLNLRECPKCHGEGFKTYINAESGLGNCFHGSCGEKFNAFKLIRAVSGLSGPKLDVFIKETARQQGWMPKKVRAELSKRELELPQKTFPLPIQGKNLPYLIKRGVDIGLAERFGLHYCHRGWWKTQLSDGSEKFMYFGERIIIPIFDLAGVMVSFQGRDVTGEQSPKYQFPAGFAVAGSHLYNGNSFVEGLHRHAIVGEGAFDAIGIERALSGRSDCQGMIGLATFGMHLSDGPDGQVNKFGQLHAKGLRTVTLMWDGEGRALAMAVRAGMTLMGQGLNVTIAKLPAGYDPAQGPDGQPTPPKVIIDAIFNSVKLSRLSAIRLAMEANRMKVADSSVSHS